VVYARTLGTASYTFQVSGKLWRNGLVMEDRQTGSSWSQVTGRAIDGPHRGAQLQKIEAVETTWADWYAAHPETTLLKKTEEVGASHYQSYFDDPERLGLFRAQWLAEKMPGKTVVFGLAVGSHAAAVTEDALAENGLAEFDLGGTSVVVARGRDRGVRGFAAQVRGETLAFSVDPTTNEVRDVDGSVWDLTSGRCLSGPLVGTELEDVAVTPVYWFAWSSFYPNTQVLDGR
jgi:hypothetical protein